LIIRGIMLIHLVTKGFHRCSIAYLSTGVRRYNQPFRPTGYGPQYVQGDVIGVGYRPRTGTIFFTRNGKKLEDVTHGLKSPNFFPAVGANGPCTVHVNFGQSGFVFIEANVKKWGLAPMTGSLAPPPPYGSEQGSILLESGRKNGISSSAPARAHRNSHSAVYGHIGGFPHALNPQHSRSRSGNFRIMPPTSPGPVRSPTDISLSHLVPTGDEAGESSGAAHQQHDDEESVVGLGLQDALNPPPEYTSPEGSEAGSRRNSTDSENTPLIQVLNRSRGNSSAAGAIRSPPIPSYSDAVQQGAGRHRSDSDRSSSPSSVHSER
jgi:hypothetical protein